MFLRSCTSVYVLNSKAEQYLKSGFAFLSRHHPGTPDFIRGIRDHIGISSNSGITTKGK